MKAESSNLTVYAVQSVENSLKQAFGESAVALVWKSGIFGPQGHIFVGQIVRLICDSSRRYRVFRTEHLPIKLEIVFKVHYDCRL